MSILLVLFLALTAFAQEFQYRMEGSFNTTAVPGEPGIPTTVNYTINWNETSTAIQGLYRDNYFSQAGPNIVSGTVNNDGRTMNVILPQAVSGVRSLRISTTQTGTGSGSVPVSVVTRNNVGGNIDNLDNFALLTALPAATNAQAQEESCTIGFGALTGFCGIYNGVFNEVSDNRNRCNLLTAGNPRLELGVNTVFSLYLNYIPGVTNQSSHTIGAFPPSPLTASVNINARYCAPLPGTTFVPGDCLNLNLTGDFLDQTDNPTFIGTYTITDEVNADSCSYSMSLSRELSY